MENQREIDTIAVTKTFMMVLIVLYHSCCPWMGNLWGGVNPINPSPTIGMIAQWMNTFHNHTFVFASGYLFYIQRYERGKYRNPKTDIQHRAKKLLIPYAVACLWVIPAYCIVFHPTVSEVFIKYVLAQAPSQLWFLVMLFGMYLVFYKFSDQLLAMKLPQAVIVLVSVYFGRLVIGKVIPISFFQVSSVMCFAPFYFAGMCYRKYKISRYLKSWKVTMVLVLLNPSAFFAYNYLSHGAGFVLKFGSIALLPLVSMLGILAFLSLTDKLSIERIVINRSYRILAECSMGIYLTHQQILYITQRIFNRAWILPTVSVLLNFVVAGGISFLIVKLMSKNRYGKIALGIQ